jgi:heme/copper-type cytochrome/quinol oxidase subunit 3
MTTAVHPLPPLAIDDRRGTAGMYLFILTEASLFVMLFFAYYYLGHQAPLWPPDAPPALAMPLTMLAVLLASSIVLHWGETQHRAGRRRAAKPAVAVTIVLGIAFLAIQAREYSEKLTTLRPSTNAYGSIFYAITGIHALHVLLGLCMLAYVLLLPELEPRQRPPHRPLHNVSLYWHFVDAVWVLIVAQIYLLPHVTRFAP